VIATHLRKHERQLRLNRDANSFGLEPSWNGWPMDARRLAEVVGRDHALDLIAAHWSARVRRAAAKLHVPAKLTPDHGLAQMWGNGFAADLVAVFGGQTLDPQADFDAIARALSETHAYHIAADYYRWHADHLRPTIYIHVPRRLQNDHRLVEILGESLAITLVKSHLSGEQLKIDRCRTIGETKIHIDSAIAIYARRGRTTPEIARHFLMTEQNVRVIRRNYGV
jgi:hypothetical protein